jgi:hypothetical protein
MGNLFAKKNRVCVGLYYTLKFKIVVTDSINNESLHNNIKASIQEHWLKYLSNIYNTRFDTITITLLNLYKDVYYGEVKWPSPKVDINDLNRNLMLLFPTSTYRIKGETWKGVCYIYCIDEVNRRTLFLGKN